MKSWLTHASTFLLGAMLAGTAVSLAWANSIPMLIETVTIELKVEQDVLESRARHEGDRLAELIHAGTKAHMSDGIGMAWADRHRSTPILDTVWWPIGAHSVMWISRDTDAEMIERGQGIGAAQSYARLAQLAEEQGFEDQANRFRERAAERAPMLTAEKILEMGGWTFDHTPIEAYANARTWDELQQQLAEVRSEAGYEGED